MLYDNPLEILEAMGFDGAFGMREWFGRFHVEDLEAIAQGLFHMQRGEYITWPSRSEESDDLFEQELNDAAHDLDIPYRRGLLSCEAIALAPSCLSFGVTRDYLLDKTKQFFSHHVQHALPEGSSFEEDERQGEHHLRLRLAEPSYQYVTLVRLPTHYMYRGMSEIRLELHRLIHDAIRAYSLSSLYVAPPGKSVRALHWDGAQFVDALWGITGDEYHHGVPLRA